MPSTTLRIWPGPVSSVPWAGRWALGVNAALLLAEVLGGIVLGSLALIADAAHLVSDVAGLGIALGALVLTARPISSRHSFGFARAEVLAAQPSSARCCCWLPGAGSSSQASTGSATRLPWPAGDWSRSRPLVSW